MRPSTTKIANVAESIVYNKYFLTALKYIGIILLVIFVLSKSIDLMPNFILDHLPFTSSSQYNKLKKTLDFTNNQIRLRDSTIAHNQIVIDSLNSKSYIIVNQISDNKKKIKSVGKNVAGLDSLLNNCRCL